MEKILRKITKEWLREMEACKKQVRKFTRVFPNGATISRRNLEKAVTAEVDLHWLLEQVDPHAAEGNDKALRKRLRDLCEEEYAIRVAWRSVCNYLPAEPKFRRKGFNKIEEEGVRRQSLADKEADMACIDPIIKAVYGGRKKR